MFFLECSIIWRSKMKQIPLAIGTVEALCINGQTVSHIDFELNGPVNDIHRGFDRVISGHDGEYLRSSELSKKVSRIFNWRSWTGLSAEEIQATEEILGCSIPVGCLLENIRISGIPNFSQLAPTSRLVFPIRRDHPPNQTQAILAIWEENDPCRTVGVRLAQYHAKQPDSLLQFEFVQAAKGKRGVMGFVLAAGRIVVGDVVMLYPPASIPL